MSAPLQLDAKQDYGLLSTPHFPFVKPK